MSEPVVVHCPSCSKQYRVDASMAGRKAQCKKCGARFRITENRGYDEDTICAWMSEGAPRSEAFTDAPPPEPAAKPTNGVAHTAKSSEHPKKPAHSKKPSRPAARKVPLKPIGRKLTGSQVWLERVNEDGANFEFPTVVLADDEVRSAFPCKCVGCGSKTALRVNLICWPDRMSGITAEKRAAHQDAVVGTHEDFGRTTGPALLAQLSKQPNVRPPFNLPFPIFSCMHCHAGREIIADVSMRNGNPTCRLSVKSLALAVDFFRACGGRNTAEYQRLIEARDLQHDEWRSLALEIRERVSHWYAPQQGEHFVQFYRDTDFGAAETGQSGMVLTDRRLVCKKYAACRDFPLTETGRMEIRSAGAVANVRVFEDGQRPASLKLEARDAADLAAHLNKLGCPWTVIR